MRDIKFRAWAKEAKEMSEIFYFNEHIDVNDNFEDDTELMYMQYTGLKDKNGVEIYEGDICKIACNPYHGNYEVKQGVYKLTPQHKHQIEVEHIGFYLTGSTDIIPLAYAVTQPRDYFASKHFIEVVGNIYEYPELME